MIYTIARSFTDQRADAMYGIMVSPISGEYMTCERMWHDNTPGKSAIPPGQYHLVPHNGAKYTNTYAFVGQTVSHYVAAGIPRSTCVVHWEDDGMYLQGCMSIGLDVVFTPGGSKLRDNRVNKILDEISQARFGGEDIYFNITEAEL